MNSNSYQKLITQMISITVVGCFFSFSVYAENEDINEQKAESNVEALKQTKVNVDDKSFSCIRDMTPVRHFYVDNMLGDIDSTLAAANAPEGAKYPTGSVVQLVPTEVMVKREPGTSLATGDWEFFELEVNDNGSKIAKRGFVDVVNRFDGNCFSCHAPAREPWDFICESGHGCEPIPIDHKMTGALQRSDPRCGEAVPEDGDWMALAKLKTMVSIGLAKKWVEGLF